MSKNRRYLEIQGTPEPEQEQPSLVPITEPVAGQETQARPQPGAGIRVGPLRHQRGLLGNDLSVAASAAGQGPALEAILVMYDGSALFRDRFASPLREFSRHWARVGQGTPGMHHKLEVSVWDADGNEHRGSEEWDDQ